VNTCHTWHPGILSPAEGITGHALLHDNARYLTGKGIFVAKPVASHEMNNLCYKHFLKYFQVKEHRTLRGNFWNMYTNVYMISCVSCFGSNASSQFIFDDL
jgi:hypothetical protein